MSSVKVRMGLNPDKIQYPHEETLFIIFTADFFRGMF